MKHYVILHCYVFTRVGPHYNMAILYFTLLGRCSQVASLQRAGPVFVNGFCCSHRLGSWRTCKHGFQRYGREMRGGGKRGGRGEGEVVVYETWEEKRRRCYFPIFTSVGTLCSHSLLRRLLARFYSRWPWIESQQGGLIFPFSCLDVRGRHIPHEEQWVATWMGSD